MRYPLKTAAKAMGNAFLNMGNFLPHLPPGGLGAGSPQKQKTFQVEQGIKFVASRQGIHLNYKNR